MARVWPLLSALAFVACTAAEAPAEAPAVPAEPPSEALFERPGDPRWLVLPALARCDVAIAADPVAAGVRLEWKPCPGGQVGCRALIPATTDAHGRQIIGLGAEHELRAASTPSGVVLAIHDIDPTSSREQVTLARLDGPPFLVFDLPGRGGVCSLRGIELGDVTAGITLGDKGPAQPELIFLVGPYHADGAWHRPLARAGRVGPATLTGRTVVTTSGGVRRSDAQTGQFVEVAAEAAATSAFAIGTSTVFLADDKIQVAVTPGVAPRILHPKPGAADDSKLADLQLRDGALYWAHGVVNARDDSIARVELWTAPATDDPARFTPRKITSLEIDELPGQFRFEPLQVGAGKLAVHYKDTSRQPHLFVIDVATGERRTWQPPADITASELLFVSADELGLQVRMSRKYTTLRVRLDTLTPGP